jgi:hypothetical protein
MKKVVSFMLLVICSILVFSEDIPGSDILIMEKKLDQIMIEIRKLPIEKQMKINMLVLDIKEILSKSEERPEIQVNTFSDTEMNAFIERVKKAWPYRDQKPIIILTVKNNRFYMKQVKQLINIIDFPKDKKDVVSILLPTVMDPENIDQLYDVFWTKDDKEYINSLVGLTK